MLLATLLNVFSLINDGDDCERSTMDHQMKTVGEIIGSAPETSLDWESILKERGRFWEWHSRKYPLKIWWWSRAQIGAYRNWPWWGYRGDRWSRNKCDCRSVEHCKTCGTGTDWLSMFLEGVSEIVPLCAAGQGPAGVHQEVERASGLFSSARVPCFFTGLPSSAESRGHPFSERGGAWCQVCLSEGVSCVISQTISRRVSRNKHTVRRIRCGGLGKDQLCTHRGPSRRTGERIVQSNSMAWRSCAWVGEPSYTQMASPRLPTTELCGRSKHHSRLGIAPKIVRSEPKPRSADGVVGVRWFNRTWPPSSTCACQDSSNFYPKVLVHSFANSFLIFFCEEKLKENLRNQCNVWIDGGYMFMRHSSEASGRLSISSPHECGFESRSARLAPGQRESRQLLPMSVWKKCEPNLQPDFYIRNAIVRTQSPSKWMLRRKHCLRFSFQAGPDSTQVWHNEIVFCCIQTLTFSHGNPVPSVARWTCVQEKLNLRIFNFLFTWSLEFQDCSCEEIQSIALFVFRLGFHASAW